MGGERVRESVVRPAQPRPVLVGVSGSRICYEHGTLAVLFDALVNAHCLATREGSAAARSHPLKLCDVST